ncbi:hypothetical protein Y032_0012g1714 [Ancylostoma ceylanicum]|uniref:Uncharacterized protein n=1 Tax=Ancylostoma ceylanicum TaxID=53326 RepID=A0A016VEH7_9BILA|nr:hypothetical protein Y032_0012g1714 [Ancylostoma ceylanicum]
MYAAPERTRKCYTSTLSATVNQSEERTEEEQPKWVRRNGHIHIQRLYDDQMKTNGWRTPNDELIKANQFVFYSYELRELFLFLSRGDQA